ncbi:MAG: TIR domain-containing protein [Burkholderiales bacterium]|jgi:hypothetical protein|nr:TIR domain-containing protein [Burkholderiales bacterium]
METTEVPKKFHVALSFAGEDRVYVDAVAKALQAEGVDIFYDKFEEVDLWGKYLYTHLSDVYQNRAVFTVMFVSDAYRKKLWTNHERKSAQARAFTESHEYILPAFFDESVEEPGLLKTTGHIALAGRSPAALAELITKKLRKAGVRLKQAFSYSDEAKADVDFSLKNGNKIAGLIKAMKTYNWYQQNPAVVAVLELDWGKVSADEACAGSQSISMRLWKRESSGRVLGQAASGVGFHSNRAGARYVERNVLRGLLQCCWRVPLRQDQGTVFGEVAGYSNGEEVRARNAIHPTDA